MQVIGHRGASALVRENTIEAFQRAFDDGADGIELDARPCGSGELVVLHDDRLDRLWGDPRPVDRVPLGEIRRVAPGVPTLDDVWDAVGDRGLFHLEVKRARFPRAAEAVRRWVRRRDLHRRSQGLWLSSFDPRILGWLALGVPRVPRGFLFERARGPIPPTTIARLLACRAIHPRWSLVTEGLVLEARRARMAVHVWTVDDEAELRRLAALGVDAVISNDPARARRSLKPQ